MRIAYDGKPYDIDNMAWDTEEDSVEIIQYLRPDAKRRRMLCTVGKELAQKTKELGIIISAEELTTGEVAIYTRKKGEPIEKERLQIATNGLGENNPQNILIKMLKKEIKQP